MARKKSPIRSIAFVSLGCPKNLVDSERMLGLLAQDGLVVTPDADEADAIVINTCGFLEASKTESMREIHDAIRMKEDGRCQRVVVAGCLVQRHKTRLLAEAPGIDSLVGVFDREHIVQAVRGQRNPGHADGHFLGKYHDLSKHAATDVNRDDPSESKAKALPIFEDDRARLRLTPRHYAFLRISEGCNQGCAFCTIPSIRGPMRSKPIEQILAEATELAADGAVELNLIGQDTTSFGTDIGYAPGLAGLLKTLDRALTDVRWLRLMYAYPSCFTDEMIDAIAQSSRVVKYIDMPLQHINDEILTRMRRRVTRGQIETLLEKLRRRVPGITIRTTFIAGAPGETDAQHDELVQFVRDAGFDNMGVFAYSPEPGTPMGRATDQIPDAVRARRVEELMLAQQEIAFAKNRQMIGRSIEVLVDRLAAGAGNADSSEGFVARHAGQAPDIDGTVLVQADDLHPGSVIDVQVSSADGYDLIAQRPATKSRSLPVLVQ
jgi:ribosomal protein S12 methylthiotransferase